MQPNESVHHEVLPNGLTILLRETHLAPVANVQIWAGVGSADERPDEAGLAHFHEHMLFKGTERRGVGEVAGEIEGAGGRINAYTSASTSPSTTPRCRAIALRWGSTCSSDAVRHSKFDPTEIDREIEVVLEEIRRSRRLALPRAERRRLRRATYREHPYGEPILGPMESVSAINARARHKLLAPLVHARQHDGGGGRRLRRARSSRDEIGAEVRRRQARRACEAHAQSSSPSKDELRTAVLQKPVRAHTPRPGPGPAQRFRETGRHLPRPARRSCSANAESEPPRAQAYVRATGSRTASTPPPIPPSTRVCSPSTSSSTRSARSTRSRRDDARDRAHPDPSA